MPFLLLKLSENASFKIFLDNLQTSLISNVKVPDYSFGCNRVSSEYRCANSQLSRRKHFLYGMLLV